MWRIVANCCEFGGDFGREIQGFREALIEYAALMEPEPLRFSPVFSLKLGHSEVCGFARACVAAGLEVECTAVAAPGVDLAAARALSEELGAKGFRERSWHE